jgi:hypothetical protein
VIELHDLTSIVTALSLALWAGLIVWSVILPVVLGLFRVTKRGRDR